MLTGSITEDARPPIRSRAPRTSTDVDGEDNNAFTDGGTAPASVSGTYGSLTITSAGVWTYTLDNSAGGATDLLAGGATAPDTFTIMAADGTRGTVTITITGVDDAINPERRI